MPEQETPGSGGSPNPTPEAIDRIIEAQLGRARQEEMLDIYADLLTTIWNRIQPTLGRMTVVMIMERALALAREKHPLAGHLQATPQGLVFDALRQKIETEDHDAVRGALREVITTLIDILVMLTGNILVRPVLQEMEKRGEL